jgi:CBS-domain-containing membrane protein
MKRWCVSDVMTTEVVTVGVGTGYKEIADLLVARAISAVPVIDSERRVLGIVSEADLLAKLYHADGHRGHPLLSRRGRSDAAKAAGDTAGELMTSPAATIGEGATVSRAARLMEAARVKRLPVVDADGRLVGVVSRRDLVRLYARPDHAIGDGVRDVLRALWIDLTRIEVGVRDGLVTLTGTVDRRSTVAIAVRFTQAVPGVVDVVNALVYEFDDGEISDSDLEQPAEASPAGAGR